MTSTEEDRGTTTFAPRFPLRAMAALGLIWSFLALLTSLAIGMISGQWLRMALGFPILVGALWLFWFLVCRLMMSLLRGGLRLHIGPDGLCRQHRASRCFVPWDLVRRVRIHPVEWPHDDSVEVHTADGRVLDLKEFERVDDIAREISKRVGPNVPVERGSRAGRKRSGDDP